VPPLPDPELRRETGQELNKECDGVCASALPDGGQRADAFILLFQPRQFVQSLSQHKSVHIARRSGHGIPRIPSGDVEAESRPTGSSQLTASSAEPGSYEGVTG
jgi:hypothetical protein